MYTEIIALIVAMTDLTSNSFQLHRNTFFFNIQ